MQTPTAQSQSDRSPGGEGPALTNRGTLLVMLRHDSEYARMSGSTADGSTHSGIPRSTRVKTIRPALPQSKAD